MPGGYTTVECTVLSTSEDSIQIQFEPGTDNEQDLWVPRTLVKGIGKWDDNDLDLDDVTELDIADEFLSKHGIETE